ncbi:MAG: serine/threonine-protein kinase [Pyrinomonadaceae bacterium]
MTRRLQIGETIGDYRIVGFLGAGGMGSVYHGIHTKIDRPAAIKVLSDTTHGTTFKERFFNEARVQSSLHHPNIATLFDFQESADGNELFIAMEYVDGETLDALIERRSLAVEDALVTFKSICEAVKFIHENNIVHRDIKPQNIKISSKGVVKMLDFGIAKDAISDGLTRIGGIVGTPNYLAPEQLMGQPASRVTDIWALGVLFYEMLTGAAPFKGSTLAELHGQISNSYFEQPQKLNSAVSNEVATIVDKCLSVDVRHRYGSVDQILEDVGASLRRRQHPAAQAERVTGIRELFTPTGSLDPNEDGQRARRGYGLVRIALIASGPAVVLAVVVFGLWAMSGSDRLPEVANGTPSTTRPLTGKNANVQGGRITAQSGRQSGVTPARPKARIEVTEGVADVFRDGQLIGSTPIEIDGNENETVDLTLKRAGYQDRSEKIEITTRRKVFTFTLRKNR